MTESIKNCLRAAHAELKMAKSLIQVEISSYPAPISGCDVQFNALLAERQKVAAALQCLEETVFVPTPRRPAQSAGIESR